MRPKENEGNVLVQRLLVSAAEFVKSYLDFQVQGGESEAMHAAGSQVTSCMREMLSCVDGGAARQLQFARLTSVEYKLIFKEKGYNKKEVAELFGVGPRRMGDIIKDHDRNPYYDYAVIGLPPKSK